jgi:Zn-dependent peptidase ImmA (M78 family)/transcriptional regulator with XRE-family HTH domain
MQLNDRNPLDVGANIAYARKQAGLTQAALAEAMGVSRPILVSIEAGQRRPTEKQLVTISEQTRSRIRDLLSLSAPDASMTVRFRSLKNADEAQHAVTALEDFGRRYIKLETIAHDRIGRREPAEFPIGRVTNVARFADDLASTERLRLGLGDGPLPDLRVVFEEDTGLRIFGLEELRGTRISGIFAYSGEYGPLIGFNPAQDPRRIRWTLCHEYAHYLTERYEPEVTVDFENSGARKDVGETFADAFAGRFLMPATGLSRRFHEMLKDADGTLRVAHLLMLAKFFQVSFQAATKRLEEIGLVTRGYYEMLLQRGFRVRDAEQMLGIDRGESPMDRLPVRYVMLVTRLYAAGEISEGDVATYFRTDRLTARAILQSVPESSGRTDVEPGLDTRVEIAG